MKKIFTLFAAALTAISASATFYAFDGTTLTQEMSLVNDATAKVYVGNLGEDGATSSVFEISDYEAFYTPVNCALDPSERAYPTRTLTFCDHEFEYAAYVRTESNPTLVAPEGAPYSTADDMGRGEINCVTILVEPKKDCMISFYYMRGATKTFDCFDSYTGTAVEYASDSLMRQETVTDCGDNDIKNEFHLTTFELQKDHVYTFYTHGGTTQLFGVETNTTPTALENTTATERKAQKVIENGHVVILRNGKKFNLVGAEL